MLTVFSSVIFVGSLILLILLTIQLFFTVGLTSTKLAQGSRTDSGIYPKRSRNVNAWYIPTKMDVSSLPDTSVTPNTPPPYPLEVVIGGVKVPKRIGIAPTTACPIFRAQDDGSTKPVLIG